MGIFDFLKRSAAEKHDLTQDERNEGGETRSIQTQLKRARADLELARLRLEAERDQIRIRAEIEEAKLDLADLMGDNEEEDQSAGSSPEDAILTAFLGKIMAGQGQQPAITAPAQIQKVEVEDQQIAAIWAQIPKDQQRIAKKLSDDQLKAYINGSLPGISDSSLDRAVAFVRKA